MGRGRGRDRAEMPRASPSREAASGRSHAYQRAKHATGISLALVIVPKAHRGAHGAPGGAPFEEKPVGGRRSKTDFGRLLASNH